MTVNITPEHLEGFLIGLLIGGVITFKAFAWVMAETVKKLVDEFKKRGEL